VDRGFREQERFATADLEDQGARNRLVREKHRTVAAVKPITPVRRQTYEPKWSQLDIKETAIQFFFRTSLLPEPMDWPDPLMALFSYRHRGMKFKHG